MTVPVGERPPAQQTRRPVSSRPPFPTPTSRRRGKRRPGPFETTAKRRHKRLDRKAGRAARRAALLAVAVKARDQAWEAIRPRPPEDPEERQERRMLILGLTLSLVGLCLLAFVAYAFVFTGLSESRDQHALLGEYAKGDPALLLGINVQQGQPIGILEIPAFGTSLVVVKGTTATDLTEGPGLMTGSAPPGVKGNAVIAGRRSTGGAPFGRILDLQPGDHLIMVTGLGKFTYAVTGVGAAKPGAPDPISPTLTPTLTLVTSNPPVLVTGRAYVRARLISAAAQAPVWKHVPPPSARALSGDPDAVVPSILWGAVLAIALMVTITAYRRFQARIWVVYLLTTPVVLAVALLWFENVYRLLPATL